MRKNYQPAGASKSAGAFSKADHKRAIADWTRDYGQKPTFRNYVRGAAKHPLDLPYTWQCLNPPEDSSTAPIPPLPVHATDGRYIDRATREAYQRLLECLTEPQERHQGNLIELAFSIADHSDRDAGLKWMLRLQVISCLRRHADLEKLDAVLAEYGLNVPPPEWWIRLKEKKK